MFSSLSRLSIRNRIWSIVAILIGSVVIGAWLDGLALRDALWREKEVKTQNLVLAGHDVVQHFHLLQADGVLSAADAQHAAIGAIRAMRRSETDYLWIADLSDKVPKMLMHPLLPALEGQVLDTSRWRDTANSPNSPPAST